MGLFQINLQRKFEAPGNGFLVDDECIFGAEVSVVNKSDRFTEYLSVWKIGSPHKRDWKISNFSKLKESWTSEEFTAGKHKWKIPLYPNGNGTGEGLTVSVFLKSVSSERFAPHEKVKADFRLHIKDQLHDEQLYPGTSSHWFTFSSPNYGYAALLPLSDMRDPNKGYIVNDCCVVEAQVSVQAVVS